MRQTAVMLQPDQNKSRQQSNPTFTSFFSWKAQVQKRNQNHFLHLWVPTSAAMQLLHQRCYRHGWVAKRELQNYRAVLWCFLNTYNTHQPFSYFPEKPGQQILWGSTQVAYLDIKSSLKVLHSWPKVYVGERFCYFSLFTFNRWKNWGYYHFLIIILCHYRTV